jgi:hypothetical protein
MDGQKSHNIAVKAAMQMVKEGEAAGLAWSEIAISCETAVAIVVSAAAQMAGNGDPHRFAQEMIDLITERAHGRVQTLLRGQPYAG